MNKTDVALSRYLRDLPHIPALTPKEEIELGGRIQNEDGSRARKFQAALAQTRGLNLAADLLERAFKMGNRGPLSIR